MNSSYLLLDAICALIITFVLIQIRTRRKENSFYKSYFLFSIFCLFTIFVDVIYELIYGVRNNHQHLYYVINIIFAIVGVSCLFLNHRMLLKFSDSKLLKNKVFNVIQYIVFAVAIILISINFFYPLFVYQEVDETLFKVNVFSITFVVLILGILSFTIGYGIYYAFKTKGISKVRRVSYIVLAVLPLLILLCIFDINIPITTIVITILVSMFYFNNLSEVSLKNALILKQKNDLEDAIDKISHDASVIKSIKSMFVCIYYIDLTTGLFEEISKTDVEEISSFIGDKGVAQDKLDTMCESMVVPEQKNDLYEFSRLSTIKERLANKISVSIQFIGTHVGWCEGSFIRAKEDKTGNIVGILWVIKSAKDIKRLEEASYQDDLTNVSNRRAFDEDSNKEITKDLVVVSFDVNGLKHANDTLGHAAGDEMLMGAASVISDVYGKYGKIYRIGGDEFIAIINNDNVVSLYDEFKEKLENWEGNKIKNISVSVGCALSSDNPKSDIHELTAIADQMMYTNKRKYYSEQKEKRVQ